jgi:dTDP-glucose pyrophosphorylase
MNTKRDVVGVILAGGRGTRMEPFSSQFPKPILPVCNKPLMEYHLESMANIGIKEVFIVIGHLGYEISLAIKAHACRQMKIHFIEQSEALGIAHALGQLQGHVKHPFLLFLGDIFFRTQGLAQMVETFRNRDSGSFLVVKEDSPEAIQKNFAVILDSDTGLVRRVIEKPRHVKNTLKGCGLYLFDLPIFDAIRRTPRTAMRNEYEITDAIQILIEDGEPVEIAKVVDEDLNMTTPYDLHRCNMTQLQVLGYDNLIDSGACIHPEATLDRCIIGPGVHIGHPVHLTNCVVLPNTRVDINGGTLSNYILAPNAAVDCSLKLQG